MDTGWLDIGEAPRDGEPLLANGPLGPHVVVWGWKEKTGKEVHVHVGNPDHPEGKWISYTDPRREYPGATHFMPIPPLEQKEGG